MYEMYECGKERRLGGWNIGLYRGMLVDKNKNESNVIIVDRGVFF